MILAFLFPTFIEEQSNQTSKDGLGYLYKTCAFYSFDRGLKLHILVEKHPEMTDLSSYEDIVVNGFNDRVINRAFNVDNIVKASSSDSELTNVRPDSLAYKIIVKPLEHYLAFGCPVNDNTSFLNGWIQRLNLNRETLNKLLEIKTEKEFKNALESELFTDKDCEQLELFARAYTQTAVESSKY